MTLSEPTTGPLGARRDAPGDGGPADPASPVRQWRRATLAALADDPRRQPPVVDGYAVGTLLGAGGSSVVWSGTGVDGVERALKVLAPHTDTDLLAELSVLRRVRHPRVVAVQDISTTSDGRPVLVLDLVPGGSLAGLLTRRRRLSAGEVSGLLAVLGPALEDLHAAGVVHGDIAPGNVLLDARGEPVLADLGVARALGRRHGSVLGTPGFADPAAVAGEGVGAASDVYGLAALAWYALTGEPPAPGGAFAARAARRRALADLPPGNGAPVLEALREGLHRKPSRRPTPGELASAVAAAARPRPVRGLTAPAAGAVPAAPVPAPPRVTQLVADPAVGPEVDPEVDPAPVRTSHPRPASARGSVRGSVRGSTPPSARGSARASTRSDARRVARPQRGRPSHRLVVAGTLPVVAAVAVVLLWRTGVFEGPAPAPSTAAAGAVLAPRAAAPVPDEPAPDEPAPDEPVTTEPVATEPATEATGSDVLRGDDAGAVVAELADRRARALSSGQATGLGLVDVAGSPARTADEQLLAELTAGGATVEALGFDVRAVREVDRAADRWVLQADVTTGEHVVVSAAGTRRTVPAGRPRTSTLTLQRVAGEWRVSDVG